MRFDIDTWVDTNFKVIKKAGAERYILCPLHNDKEQSAQINIDKKVFNCHAGCGGMSLWDLSKRLGIIPPETKKEIESYDYQDETGMIIYIVKRYESKYGHSKTFAIWNNINQSWGLGNLQKVPYNLPGILKAIKDNKPIMIVEGEKDANTLIKRGYIATTNNGGCGSTRYWDDFKKYFPPKTKIYIFPDHDEPGMKHAKKIGEILNNTGCEVKIINLGYTIEEKHGKDISDWSKDGHTKSDFENLLKNARNIDDEIIKETLEESELYYKDMGHAYCLEGFYKNNIRWARHKNSWMCYNGKFWKEIDEEKVAVISANYLKKEYRKRIEQNIDRKNRSFYETGLKETNLSSKLKGALYFLKGWEGIAIDGELWNKNYWLLNCDNGTFDLKTFEFKKHDPNDLITKIAPVNYDETVKNGEWQKHLDYFIPNKSIQRELQRNLGIGLTGAVLDEILPIWYGTGGNGKTTTSRIITTILGSYVRNANAKLLTNTKQDEHPEAIADLSGSRFVFCSEISRGTKLAEGFIKSLTGGEIKRSRFLYGSRFDFEQTFSVFLLVNDKPKIIGTDEGIWRRIRLIPWTIKIEKDKQLNQDEIHNRLKQDGSAILNWLIEGLKDFNKDRKWIAEEVMTATNDYRAEENLVSGFLIYYTDEKATHSISFESLYEAFEKYCKQIDEEIISKIALGKKLKDMGFESKRGTGNAKYIIGIRLKKEYIDNGEIFNQKSEIVTNSYQFDTFSETIQKNKIPNTFSNIAKTVTNSNSDKKPEDIINNIFDNITPDIY